jgi:NADP-dependent alcohol dehydrogenase
VNNFEFYNPVRIIFGKDQLLRLSELIPAGTKILLLYGGGSIRKNGIYDKVTAALAGYTFFEFGGIEPNPSLETSIKAVELIKENNIDFILAVGGGSVIDAAKFIGAASLYEGTDPWDILAKGAPVLKTIPIGTILTLPATGSEMNAGSVITNKAKAQKLAFKVSLNFPKFSILMPNAAASLPQKQVANGIVDAFVHVVEQYATYCTNNPLQDRFAESILQTLIEEGPKVYADPSDYDAMSNLMLCASLALNGLIGSGVPQDWSVHAIGHELTVLHGIDHARTLAIVLPGVWKYLLGQKKDKLVQYGRRVLNITTGTDDEIAELAIEKTVDFFESLGIKTKLSDYNIGQNTIDLISRRLEERGWLQFGDRGMVNPANVKDILALQLN